VVTIVPSRIHGKVRGVKQEGCGRRPRGGEGGGCRWRNVGRRKVPVHGERKAAGGVE